MTEIFYQPEEYRIKISGHAGAAPAGEDLVCAAVTALALTLVQAAESVEEYDAAIVSDQKKGLLDVWCDPAEGVQRTCGYMLGVIAGGLRLIAEKYPEYVRFTEMADPSVGCADSSLSQRELKRKG